MFLHRTPQQMSPKFFPVIFVSVWLDNEWIEKQHLADLSFGVCGFECLGFFVVVVNVLLACSLCSFAVRFFRDGFVRFRRFWAFQIAAVVRSDCCSMLSQLSPARFRFDKHY